VGAEALIAERIVAIVYLVVLKHVEGDHRRIRILNQIEHISRNEIILIRTRVLSIESAALRTPTATRLLKALTIPRPVSVQTLLALILLIQTKITAGISIA
jgi:hypothetical protein